MRGIRVTDMERAIVRAGFSEGKTDRQIAADIGRLCERHRGTEVPPVRVEKIRLSLGLKRRSSPGASGEAMSETERRRLADARPSLPLPQRAGLVVDSPTVSVRTVEPARFTVVIEGPGLDVTREITQDKVNQIMTALFG